MSVNFTISDREHDQAGLDLLRDGYFAGGQASGGGRHVVLVTGDALLDCEARALREAGDVLFRAHPILAVAVATEGAARIDGLSRNESR